MGCALLVVLLCSEFYQYLYAPPVFEMGVSQERLALLPVHLDITFPRLPCALLSVDMMDSSGEVESDSMAGIEHMQLHKVRLDARGRRATRGDYIVPPPDMLTIVGGMLIPDSEQHVSDMERELKDGEGCHVAGELRVKRLQGVFRLTAHMKDYMQLASTQAEVQRAIDAAMRRDHPGAEPELLQIHSDYSRINMSHHIHRLGFGPHYPGRVNPLDGYDRAVDHDRYGTFRYFLKIVPATYVSTLLATTRTYLYSVTEYYVPGLGSGHNTGEAAVEQMPALEFRFDMSPLAVTVSYPHRALGHFAVRLCAVVGGCFALTGLLDKVVHAAAGALA